MPDNDKSLIEKVRFALAFSIWWVRRIITFKDVRAADSFNDLSESGQIRVTLLPFDGQQWYHQFLIFALGIGVWIGTYAGIMHGMGWVEYATLDTPEAMQYRRYAGTGALVVAVAYYGLLWTRAYGGPMTNLLWYPLLTIALMPRAVLGLFMGAPERRFSAGGIVGEPVRWSADVLTMLILGYGLPLFFIWIGIMLYWTYGGERGRHHRIEWHRKWPDITLRYEPSGGWENLDEDLRQVHLEAGYEPDQEATSNTSTDESVSSPKKEKRDQ